MDKLVFYIIAFIATIQLRADGSFPFPKSWSKEAMMVVVLVQAVLVTYFIVKICYLLILRRAAKLVDVPDKACIVVSAIVPPIALFAICGLHYIQSGYYAGAGYEYSAGVFGLLLLLSLTPLALFWLNYLRTKRYSTQLYLICILLSVLAIKFIPLMLFPLSTIRSDMLPIIREAGLNIINGLNPYQFYVIDGQQSYYNFRLPGLIMAYLPATVLGLDLRFVNLVCEAILVLLFVNRLGPLCKGGRVPWGIVLALAFFLYFPYWHYRHELYEAPFWIVLYLGIMALYEKRVAIFTICLGLMIGMHQWGWVFAPFMLIALFKRQGIRAAIVAAVVSTILGNSIIIAGAWPYMGSFYEHIFLSYGKIPCVWETFDPSSISFTPLFVKYSLCGFIKPVQLLIQAALLFLTLRYGEDMESLMGILALSLFGLILFSPVSWNYQYLLVILLMIMGMSFRDARAVSGIPVRRPL